MLNKQSPAVSQGASAFGVVETWSMPAANVQERPHRMEAVFFASDGYHALERMRHSGFELSPMKDLARIIWFGPFARKYVDSPESGLPFLTSSTMMEAWPRPSRLVSIKHTKHLESLKVYEGYILVSCSGSVGNVVLCTEDVHGWACSQDAIRVAPIDGIDRGTIYCFLQSPLGQFLLKRSHTGSVIRHIYEADVSALPVPHLPIHLKKTLNRLITGAIALRAESNRLLKEAETAITSQFQAPSESNENSVIDIAESRLEVFSVGAQELLRSREYGRIRLDATRFNPAAQNIRSRLIREGGIPLGSVLLDIRNSNLRKRLYVDDHSNGVPLIGGKHLSMLRPTEMKYLSKRTRGLANERVRNGWVLVSCGGTVGRTLLVHRNFDDAVMSQHVMRLIPNMEQVLPGYIAAFLASPYGQAQLRQLSYGSVQEELRDFHFRDVVITVPRDRGQSIHNQVIRAYDCRADALESENEAYGLFMDAINQGRQATEAQWGQ